MTKDSARGRGHDDSPRWTGHRLQVSSAILLAIAILAPQLHVEVNVVIAVHRTARVHNWLWRVDRCRVRGGHAARTAETIGLDRARFRRFDFAAPIAGLARIRHLDGNRTMLAAIAMRVEIPATLRLGHRHAAVTVATGTGDCFPHDTATAITAAHTSAAPTHAITASQG